MPETKARISSSESPRSIQVLEDRRDRGVRPQMLAASVLAEIDLFEHERAEREHRRAHLLALHDVAGALGGLDQVVNKRVDSARSGVAEQLDLGTGQVLGHQQPPAERIVDVVVDVRDPVDDTDDLAFERLGLLSACVGEDPVANLARQVQRLRYPQRLLVVAKARAKSLPQAGVEPLLAGVAERRMTHVVPEPDRLGQVLVEPERTGDDACDAGRLERVCDPGAVVIPGGVDEDLRLALQAPERLRVNDPIAVALERCTDATLVLLTEASACLVGANRKR